jgi:curli biogenesis system outer membrane secretion channel CsgG
MKNQVICKSLMFALISIITLPALLNAQRMESPAPADSLAKATPIKGGRIKIAVIPQDPVPNRGWTKDIMMASLEDAVVTAGRFDVLSRSELNAVLAEQKFANSDLVDPSAAVKVGKALSAQYVVIIRAVSLELKNGGYTFGGIGKKSVAMNANVQIQLINTETTQIVDSKTYSAKKENSIAVLGEEPAGTPQNQVQAPGENEFRVLVQGFATDFANRLSAAIPIEASVVIVKNNLIGIDAGAEKAVKPGVRFEVAVEGEVIKDAAGNVLSHDSTKVGVIRVVRVEPKMSWCELIQSFDPSGTPDPTPNLTRVQRDDEVRQAE